MILNYWHLSCVFLALVDFFAQAFAWRAKVTCAEYNCRLMFSYICWIGLPDIQFYRFYPLAVDNFYRKPKYTSFKFVAINIKNWERGIDSSVSVEKCWFSTSTDFSILFVRAGFAKSETAIFLWEQLIYFIQQDVNMKLYLFMWNQFGNNI